ncbi:TetR family transcriptional regulator [Kribbella turkmenica]|uniref:TetR family transcriptional regulator n=1 Tax=Kribbella turkmenica TaxID=2530375 RepID=UPI00192DDEE5
MPASSNRPQISPAQGVHATKNEKLRRAAGVSGSRLNDYFPNKDSLALAVIAGQAERVLAFTGVSDSPASTASGFGEWAAC